MNNSEFSDAIKKIKKDCELYGSSKNHLAEILKKQKNINIIVNSNKKNNYVEGKSDYV